MESSDETLAVDIALAGAGASFRMRSLCWYEALVRFICSIPTRKGCRKRTERQGIPCFFALLSDEAEESRPDRRNRCTPVSRLRFLPL